MTTSNIIQDISKKSAVSKALEIIPRQPKLGLGTGRMVELFLIEMSKTDWRPVFLSSSERSTNFAKNLGFQVSTDFTDVSMVVDGADLFDVKKNLIKGQGGALTREKMIAEVGSKYYVLVTEEKQTDTFLNCKIPVEIIQFLPEKTTDSLRQLGLKIDFRLDSNGDKFITDNGNYIVDCTLLEDLELVQLGLKIKLITGVVEHGIFCNYNPTIISGNLDGSVSIFD